MSIFEVTKVLWLRGIRGSNLPRLDLQSRLAEASTREKLFICSMSQHKLGRECALNAIKLTLRTGALLDQRVPLCRK